MNRFEYMDRPLEAFREVPIYQTTYTTDGKQPIESIIYPHHEAKVLRAKAATCLRISSAS